MTIADAKAALKASWGAAAPGWDRWFGWYERTFAPVIRWCVDAIGARPGLSVLDIACGTGQPALAVARRVAPDGSVVATDVAPEMLAVARRRASESGLTCVAFSEADAEDLPFRDASFDAVTCAFALMFCPDPDRAVGEVRRVLKPGGRAAFVVWDEAARNSFLTTAGQHVGRFLQSPPPNPNAPGPFRLAPPGELDRLLRSNGFAEVAVDSVPISAEFGSADEYWEAFTDHAAGLKGKIAKLSHDDQTSLRTAVCDAAARHLDGGPVRLRATALCASARR